MNLTTRTWEGHVMGTEARLLIVTNDPKAGHEALVRAARDLETTEKTLSTEKNTSLVGSSVNRDLVILFALRADPGGGTGKN